ncbi:MAG: GNAT family N-acetyltransferase [Pseudomonadota bacterium]
MIRDFETGDEAALKAVIRESGLFSPDELEAFDAMIEAHLSGAEADFWCVEAEGAGAAWTAPEPMSGDVLNLRFLAVRTDARRRGLGRALVRAAVEGARQRGGRLLLVETGSGPDLERARTLYIATGFAEQGRIDDYYAPGEAKVIFALPLRLESA